ncbi:MAG TPA: hypothetical protein VFA04_06815 [Bryobacteraceae bacterium]|nr:hypothetical protein [Bryobacteraceae bacterium]
MRALKADLSNVRNADQERLATIEERLAVLELKVLGKQNGSGQP